MGLFRSNKELQFRTCSYGDPQASLVKLRRGNSFIEKGNLGGTVINKKSIGGNWEFEVVWLFIG